MKDKKPIWSRLKSFECPKCRKILSKDDNSMSYTCSCGFHIGMEKFNSIVKGMYKPKEEDDYQLN